ncbi:MAG: 16S rRNA (cytosine(1402)-N(4))-methyltransferase RsmH [Alphaproteobacteria bacterium]|nr:16S rRNA (cytosine(1402)-N(4))-methyltransferase RsmH [Alphaproteobacteria bacterium]
MNAAHIHAPVMLREVVDALRPRDGGVYVDGTFGRGGYTRAILQAADTQVWAIDRDPEAISAAAPMEKEFAPRLRVLCGRFGAMDALLHAEGVMAVDGVTLDLGVSSPQLDNPARGFSFREDGPLDMRMSNVGPSAADFVREKSEAELADIIFHYGEERHARRVARAIVAARAERPIASTGQLASIVRSVVAKARDGIDPATRTFQGLRIAVNDELGELARGLAAAETLLRPAGRLAVVSFHSLEDRCVKDFLRARSEARGNASRHLPHNDNRPSPSFALVSRKAAGPGDAEIAANPRARSARLRAAERTSNPAYPTSVPAQQEVFS